MPFSSNEIKNLTRSDKKYLEDKNFVKNIDKLNVRGVTFAYHSRLPKLQRMWRHAFGDFVL